MGDDWGPLTGPWERDADNPLITMGRGVQGGRVLLRGGCWWMFLAHYDGHVQETRLARSAEGLVWSVLPEAVLRPADPWEGSYCIGKVAAVVDDEVRLYYFGKEGIQERIGLASSTDMARWRRCAQNPVFQVSQSLEPGERLFPDAIVQHDGCQFLFYDLGFDYHHAQHPRAYRIRVATSPDGVGWEDAATAPVLSAGTAGSWDDAWVCQCSVTRIGELYYMLYIGKSTRGANKDDQSIGLARAPHPCGPWERYPDNPVFGPGASGDWDGAFLQHPYPVQTDRGWRMYYTGNSGGVYAVGVAHSQRL
jgi:predicted GH43/DUF377 family glycosyl hydrolase